MTSFKKIIAKILFCVLRRFCSVFLPLSGKQRKCWRMRYEQWWIQEFGGPRQRFLRGLNRSMDSGYLKNCSKYKPLASQRRVSNLPNPTAGLPNLFNVAGHFHMRKFIAGHKRFLWRNNKILWPNESIDFDKFYAMTRGDNESYSCTQCCQLVWM